MKGLLATLLLAGSCIQGACAHVTSTGIAELDVNDGELAYRLTLMATEQEEEIGRALLAAADGNSAAAAKVTQAMRDYARFSIAGDACTPGGSTVQGSRTGDGKVVLEMALVCPKTAGALLIRDDWPE